MTIEAGIENPGVYINSLNDTYPASGDTMTEGDNHIRGLKNVVLNTYPNVTGVVTSTHTELNYVDVATPGTVEASKAVIVDANKDALGFRRITGSTATGYTASFTYTGTTNGDRALVASVTMAAGITYAFSSESQSTTSGAAAVYAIAYGATGAVSSGYFESRSNAGFGLQVVTTVAGGVPLRADAADAIDANVVADYRKGSARFLFNPKTSAGSYNSIVQSGDQLITAVGADGLANSSVIVIAPYASDAVGIRISSVTDAVALSGTIDATGHRVTAGDTVIYRVIGAGNTTTMETVYLTTSTTHLVPGRCLSIKCLATGTIRIKLEHFTDNAFVTSSVRIVKNGSATSEVEWTVLGTTPVARIQDVPVSIGDVIAIQQKTNSASVNTNIQNCTICAATLSAAVC